MSDRIRIDEPSYVARYRESSRRAPVVEDDASLPSYVRAYRRGSAPTAPVADVVNESLRRAPAESTHSATTARLAADVYLVRHGEAVGDEHDADLTDQGAWQARSYGRTLAAQFRDGDRIAFRHAGTLRSRRTAELIRDGLLESVAGRGIEVGESEPAPAFGNVRFVGPDGPCDITEGFRAQHAHRDAHTGTGGVAPPLWLAELDRFWRLQLAGGDPIELWMSIPMLHFEPPSMVVRRLWAGIDAEARSEPGVRLVVATHTGCIRALAFAALGYDPGDLYNLEHVRAKLFEGRRHALVSHRNRSQEIAVPAAADLPVWNTVETWQSPLNQEDRAS